jgi:hypothetical protein
MTYQPKEKKVDFLVGDWRVLWICGCGSCWLIWEVVVWPDLPLPHVQCRIASDCANNQHIIDKCHFQDQGIFN